MVIYVLIPGDCRDIPDESRGLSSLVTLVESPNESPDYGCRDLPAPLASPATPCPNFQALRRPHRWLLFYCPPSDLKFYFIFRKTASRGETVTYPTPTSVSASPRALLTLWLPFLARVEAAPILRQPRLQIHTPSSPPVFPLASRGKFLGQRLAAYASNHPNLSPNPMQVTSKSSKLGGYSQMAARGWEKRRDTSTRVFQ
eukprot:1328022-Amorphochlora_amoeboformis.AAC.1